MPPAAASSAEPVRVVQDLAVRPAVGRVALPQAGVEHEPLERALAVVDRPHEPGRRGSRADVLEAADVRVELGRVVDDAHRLRARPWLLDRILRQRSG
jgi:hypothetical protein